MGYPASTWRTNEDLAQSSPPRGGGGGRGGVGGHGGENDDRNKNGPADQNLQNITCKPQRVLSSDVRKRIETNKAEAKRRREENKAAKLNRKKDGCPSPVKKKASTSLEDAAPLFEYTAKQDYPLKFTIYKITKVNQKKLKEYAKLYQRKDGYASMAPLFNEPVGGAPAAVMCGVCGDMGFPSKHPQPGCTQQGCNFNQVNNHRRA